MVFFAPVSQAEVVGGVVRRLPALSVELGLANPAGCQRQQGYRWFVHRRHSEAGPTVFPEATMGAFLELLESAVTLLNGDDAYRRLIKPLGASALRPGGRNKLAVPSNPSLRSIIAQ